MAKKPTNRGSRSVPGGKTPKPIEITKSDFLRRILGILWCCSGAGDYPTSGPRVAMPTRWADVTQSPPDYVSVAKAVAKLFPVTPVELQGVPGLSLTDGRLLLLEPKGVFKILQSENDRAPVQSRKAISAVMLLKGWTFEQSVEWMKETFGAEATRNTAQDYVSILVSKDR